MHDEQRLRETICEIGRRMYLKNLVTATDGNISCRLGGDRYLCTPSGVAKGFLAPDDLVIANGAGERVSGKGKVSSEFSTHLACYEERADVLAVVHAHPPKAIGLSLAGVSLEPLVLPEVVAALGGIPSAPYATPGTREGGQAVRELIRQCDALVLDRHGAITVGSDLMDAYFKMEKIEHAAESILVSRLLGNTRTLTEDQIARLLEARAAYGINGKFYRPLE